MKSNYEKIASGVFTVILALLLYAAAFSTTFIDRSEMPHFLPDSPTKNLMAVCFFLAVIVAFKFMAQKSIKLRAIGEKLEHDDVFFGRIKAGILWFFFAVISLWVVCTQVPATADQRYSLLAAQSIAEKNFVLLGPVSYLHIFNNQLGWTLFLYACNRVVGEFNYIAYQLMNAAAIVFILDELSELAGLFKMSRAVQLLTILLGIAFIPLTLYASFVYGTLLGLMCALAAIKYEIKYFRAGGWHLALLSAFLVCFAIMLKMNYMIFAVAMVIYAIIELTQKSKFKSPVFIVFLVMFYIAQSVFPVYIYERISGQRLNDGCSKWSWVTMGLQDDKRPGWYNSYNEYTLSESDYDAVKQEAWVKTDLKNRLEQLWDDKDAARDFFVRKTASQWNEPSFQSVWICINHLLDGYGLDVVGVDNDWPKLILSPMGNHAVSSYLNYLNFIILAGAMLYILLCSKTQNFCDSLILPVILVGGFLFHLVWEAKCQYALPYFVLLLPYTVMGYAAAAEGMLQLPGKLKNGRTALSISRRELITKLAILLLTVAILWYVFHGTLGSITGDAEAYYAYLAAHS